jgi:hypothetical protein
MSELLMQGLTWWFCSSCIGVVALSVLEIWEAGTAEYKKYHP